MHGEDIFVSLKKIRNILQNILAEVKKKKSFDKIFYGTIKCLKKFALKLMHLKKFVIRT